MKTSNNFSVANENNFSVKLPVSLINKMMQEAMHNAVDPEMLIETITRVFAKENKSHHLMQALLGVKPKFPYEIGQLVYWEECIHHEFDFESNDASYKDSVISSCVITDIYPEGQTPVKVKYFAVDFDFNAEKFVAKEFSFWLRLCDVQPIVDTDAKFLSEELLNDAIQKYFENLNKNPKDFVKQCKLLYGRD